MKVENLSPNIKHNIDPETTYEKLELLGEGSFGNVYKVRNFEILKHGVYCLPLHPV